jgi:transcriptional regulator GlxA family with amidase domain
MSSKKIVFLILPHIHLLDLAGADQVFLEARDYGADIEISYCSFASEIKTSTAFPFGRLQHFSEVQLSAGDYLIVPGAEVDYMLSADFRSQKEVFGWLNALFQQKVVLCSICTGAFVLALAGLLNGKKCTTHWKRTKQLQATFPQLQVIENILYVEDGGILTSAGVTSGIDLALHIVGLLKDEMIAFKVARELVVYMRRQGHHAQQSIFLQHRNHIHGGVHRVQDWIQENIHQKVNLDDLGEIACMSPRNLTRVFRKETGVSINDYVTLVRKERITELLKNPDLTRQQIAQRVGLKSERQVSRIVKA